MWSLKRANALYSRVETGRQLPAINRRLFWHIQHGQDLHDFTQMALKLLVHGLREPKELLGYSWLGCIPWEDQQPEFSIVRHNIQNIERVPVGTSYDIGGRNTRTNAQRRS